MYRKAFLIVIGAILFTACTKEQPGMVKVESGWVQGYLEDDLTVFKGIPFATPPVGDLRWKAPQPIGKWEGVRQATEYAAAPIQGGNPSVGKSEDCLYLNVWTPAKSKDEKIPVFVWIHGGGFSFGSASEAVCSGETFAKKGVVFVSIAYRLGSLGFLAHPELSAESSDSTSGNYGLMDMIAGLQWIKNNISAFGGDPNKVTIFGESAGGIAVSMLCVAPQAKGLFHGAISQSGGSFGPTRSKTYPGENMKTLQQAEADGKSYAERANSVSIAELRQIPADSLPSGWGMGSAWPIVDGSVIPDDQFKLYEEGKYNETPILVGYNSDEGLSFTRTKDPSEFIDQVNERYGKFANELLAAYPVGENSIPKTARDLARDAAFGWHTWSWARLQAKRAKAGVYLYCFDQHKEYPADSPMADFGSPHAQEIPYVFQHLDPTDSSLTDSDKLISKSMATYWANFAKYGDPNGPGVPQWPAFDNASQAVMYFQQTPHVGEIPSLESMRVLDNYFQWRRSEEGNPWANQ